LGKPFAGKTGALIDQLLIEAGLDPAHDVAFVNRVGCRPFNDRIPHWKEISACRPRTEYMINVIRPRVIVMLGTTAAGMAGVTSIGPWRGQPTLIKLPSFTSEIPEEYRAVITYHPSFLIKQGQMETGKYRTNVVSDLKIARAICAKVKSQ
jgi:DNA polymerase